MFGQIFRLSIPAKSVSYNRCIILKITKFDTVMAPTPDDIIYRPSLFLPLSIYVIIHTADSHILMCSASNATHVSHAYQAHGHQVWRGSTQCSFLYICNCLSGLKDNDYNVLCLLNIVNILLPVKALLWFNDPNYTITVLNFASDALRAVRKKSGQLKM